MAEAGKNRRGTAARVNQMSRWRQDALCLTLVEAQSIFTQQIGGCAVASAGIYLAWTGFGAVQSHALRRFFWDPRTFTTISKQYWQRFGPALGRSLHHWLIPQRWSWIPQAIRNAGFNLLGMPKILPGPLGLNTFMGFAVKWGGQRLVVAMIIENGVRILIPVTGVAAYHTGKWMGNELAEEAIEFYEEGATVTPLKLTPDEERRMQEDMGQSLQEELDAPDLEADVVG